MNNKPHPASNSKKSVTVKLTPLMEKRLACIEAYINSLQKACDEKKVKFNPQTMVLTKKQIHAQLEKYHPNDFNVEKDTWEKIWKAATDDGICNNYQPKTSKGESFLKSINF
ncbi:MAG: hypothetical protein ABL903_19265 [Methylococcales bacterium]